MSEDDDEHYEQSDSSQEAERDNKPIRRRRIPSPDAGTGTAEETPETDRAFADLMLVGIKFGFNEGLIHEFKKTAKSLEKRLNAALAELRARLEESPDRQSPAHG